MAEAGEIRASCVLLFVACVAGAWKWWAQENQVREKETHVSPSHARVLFFALYFQAPDTQAILFEEHILHKIIISFTYLMTILFLRDLTGGGLLHK